MKNKDFTLPTYKQSLQELRKANYSFLTLEQYCNAKNLPKHFVILRHDVDRKLENTLKIAKLDNKQYAGKRRTFLLSKF
jgi:hypothetical protein